MKNNGGGKISDHFSGVGTVTREMVLQRALEIARINGHQSHTQNDWEEAKRELLGKDDFNSNSEDEEVNTLLRWDEVPGATGRHIHNYEAPDEQIVAEELVEEGVNEAEHEQMVEASHNANDES